MVDLPNKDRTIFNLPYKVVDIINEYNNTGYIRISTQAEGLCLQSAGFYQLLDYIVKVFKIEKEKIIIETANAEEYHSDYQIYHYGNHWIDRCKSQFDKPISKKQNLKILGCFLGKPNWHRLIIASWIYNQKNILLTCHYNPDDERHRIDSELTEINVNAKHELSSVINFLSKCPVTLKHGFLNYTIEHPEHYSILEYYPEIFLDLVVETYISGLSFFPTEKTLRPIIAMTPFIIMGPQGYLQNLKRMGFKTFDSWWSEDYDNFSDYARWYEIKQILKVIINWDDNKLNSVLQEMKDILIHNRSLLQVMNSNKTKLSHEK